MNRQTGFTLLELMIVVGIIAILAAIATTMYTEQVRKGKRADARRGIAELQMALEKYRGYCPTYASSVPCLDRDGDSVIGEPGEPVYPTATSIYYTFAISAASATGYTITATRAGTMTGDPKCGNFTLVNAAGTPTQGVSSGDVSYCWAR
jgi:type IV pilus assembly protein PilE